MLVVFSFIGHEMPRSTTFASRDEDVPLDDVFDVGDSVDVTFVIALDSVLLVDEPKKSCHLSVVSLIYHGNVDVVL